MATLPRAKHGNSLTSPFRSPRKLQEISFPTPEGHDVTTAGSGVSMKQYEDQMSALRSENFNLKLRIYLLEERLDTAAPPALHQGVLEQNVRLLVEVEELKRQLCDKQELLAAAAEAIDVLEQQGSMSNDSLDASNNSAAAKQGHITQDQDVKKTQAEDTCLDSEAAGDCLGATVTSENMEELTKLRRENLKALKMIKVCMKKIQQQEKEIKKLILDKELVYAKVSDTQLEKYEEIVKCKDEHIKELEIKVKELQKVSEAIEKPDAVDGDLQHLLTRRLQGLAYFLDKLLSHKCVLGEDNQKLAESILEQSLSFPLGMQLDESMAPGDLTMDDGSFDMTHSLRLEDLTAMLGHHAMCTDDNNRHSRRAVRHHRAADLMSESECWSEPDRKVSLARVGLCDTGVAAPAHARDPSPDRPQRARRSKLSHGSRSDDNKQDTPALLDEVAKRNEQLQQENTDLKNRIDFAMIQIKDLLDEKNELKSALAQERANAIEANKGLEEMRNTVTVLETRVKDVEVQLAEAAKETVRLRAERQELESTFAETERALRRAADEATVHASQAALERARAHNERLRIERELDETRDKLNTAIDANSRLEIEFARKVAFDADDKLVVVQEAFPSEEDRPTSPDQGIDSDRLSSLEHNDAVALSPRSLYEENATLKQKLARSKALLADTLAQLNAANMRKKSVQRAICREIHKTQGVLRKARGQLETQNNENMNYAIDKREEDVKPPNAGGQRESLNNQNM